MNRKKQLTEAEMLHRAAAYCTATERCRQDVEKKITAAGFSAEVAERLLDRLTEEKFIDEARFCRSFVNDKLRFNKWGRIRLGYELKMRHIPKALIAEALDAIDEAVYLEILRGVIEGKRKTIKGKDKREAYYQLFRFAAGRGFESEMIKQCLCETDDQYEMDPEDSE